MASRAVTGCHRHAPGFLVPLGAAALAADWPDDYPAWHEDTIVGLQWLDQGQDLYRSNSYAGAVQVYRVAANGYDRLVQSHGQLRRLASSLCIRQMAAGMTS